MRSTRRSGIAWIGKSVTMVRANSLNTPDSCASLDMTLPSIHQPCLGWWGRGVPAEPC